MTSEHFTSYDEASEYLSQAYEAEGEQRAEYGMGAVSMGYDPYEWAPAYEGYRADADPMVAEAKRLLHERYELVKVITPADQELARWNAAHAHDSIPF